MINLFSFSVDIKDLLLKLFNCLQVDFLIKLPSFRLIFLFFQNLTYHIFDAKQQNVDICMLS